MYNEDIKKRYCKIKLETAMLSENFLTNIFRRSEPFEKDLGKDICNFTTQEIENMYRTMNFVSIYTLTTANSGYSGYTAWCLGQGMVNDSQNHFAEFDRARLYTLLNKAVNNMRIIPRDKVLEYCHQMPNAMDSFVMLGLFEGIRGKEFCEFLHMHGSDIDVDKNEINVYGRGVLPYSHELCVFGKEASEAEYYYSVTGSGDYSVRFETSDLVCKNYPNVNPNVSDNQKGRRIYNKLLRGFSYLGIKDWMNANALVDSGIVYMIKTESDRYGMPWRDYLSEHIGDVRKRFNRKFEKATLVQKYADYLDE